MSVSVDSPNEPLSGYHRLDEQIRWYDESSLRAQRNFKIVKLLEFFLAALVPFSAGLSAPITAAAGVLIVVAEGLQQVNQWQQNWITYRSTCEALRHEKYAFLGSAGVYDGLDADAARRLLVARVEALVSTEHAKWISRQEYVTGREAKAPPEG